MSQPAAEMVPAAPPPRRIGRPRAVSRETQRRILQHLAQGRTISVACAAEGVSRYTFHRYLREDPELESAALRAEGQGMVELEKSVFEAVLAEAAQGNASNLLRYFVYRHSRFEGKMDRLAREEEEEEHKEESGSGNDELVAVVIATVQRLLGQQGAEPRRVGG
ncbi:MAG: helix-turn-helix domain-containing protein, partial [Steroidobacteraceae bacterium]